MNTGEIKILLEKYLNGNTTLEEEKRLKAIFAGEDIPKEFLPYRDYFSYVGDVSKESLSNTGFEEKLQAKIDEESSVIPISRRKRIFWASGVAAGILILVTAFFQINRVVDRVEDTYSNPELAYQEAKKILYFVSNKFNKGTEELVQVEKLDSGMEALQPVGKFNSGLQEAGKIKKYNQIEKVFGTSN